MLIDSVSLLPGDKASLKTLGKASDKDAAALDSISQLVAEIDVGERSLAEASKITLRENKLRASVVAAAMQRMGNGQCPAPQAVYS